MDRAISHHNIFSIIMKRLIQNFILLSIAVAIASLSACTILAERTTGPVVLAQPITKYRLIWDPILPSQIVINKVRHIDATITSEDEKKAVTDNRTLYALFVRLFPQRFSEKAAPYGIYATDSPNEPASKLVLHVNSFALFCDSDCRPILGLATKLVDEKGTPIWEYSSTVANPPRLLPFPFTASKIDGSLVDAYVDALLFAMQNDRVIVRRH